MIRQRERAATLATMGACPVCGGDKRSPLAPGYWRCESIVRDFATGIAPTLGAPPALGMVSPMAVPVDRVCGHQYQEAAPQTGGHMEFCYRCSTGMIGRCDNDARSVCGFHSKMRADRRLCDECVVRFDEQAAQARLDAAFDEKLRPSIELCAKVCQQLESLAEPADRWLMLTITAAAAEGATRFDDRRLGERALRELGEVLELAADRLLGQQRSFDWIVAEGDPRHWRFDAGILVGHLARTDRLPSASATMLRLVKERLGIVRGGFKTIASLRGWLFSTGTRGSSGPYGGSGYPDRYVLEDGTRGETWHGGDELSPPWDRRQTEPPKRQAITTEMLTALLSQGRLRFPDLPPQVLESLREFDRLTWDRASHN